MPSSLTAAIAQATARSGRHLLGAVGRAFRRLALQVSAVFYLIFALSFAATGIRGWLADHRAPALAHHAASLTQAAPMTVFELALALIFGYFGLTALVRAAHTP